MSPKNTRARHRLDTVGNVDMIAASASLHGRTAGRQAAVAVAGSGLLMGLALPAQAHEVTSPVEGQAEASAPAASGSAHTVQSGDTLGAIASAYGVDLGSILMLNNLQLDTIIYPGDTILLTASASGSPVPADTGYAVPDLAFAGTVSQQSVDVEPIAVASGEAVAGSTNEAILNSAMAQLGASQDCTVLGEVALAAAGIAAGDESPESLMTYATPVSDPQPGDFVYYADGGMGFSHNAVYIGDGQAIHSGWNGNQTIVDSVNVGSGPVYYRVNG